MAHKDAYRLMVPLLQQMAVDMAYELIDVELVKEGPGRYLRIYLDKEGGITLDDCEAYHRRVQPELEAIDYDFLEVSSPGVDRPLKMDRDFERTEGQEVEIKLYVPLDGKKVWQGVLVGWDENNVRIALQDGEREIPRKAAAVIRPVIHFDEDEGREV